MTSGARYLEACRITAHGFLTTPEARFEPSGRGSWTFRIADHRCCEPSRPLSPTHRALEHRRSIRPRSGRLSGCVQAGTPSRSARGGAQTRGAMPHFLSSQSKSILSRMHAAKGTRQLCRPDKNTGGVTDSPHDRFCGGAKEDSDRQARGRPAWPTTAGWQDVEKVCAYSGLTGGCTLPMGHNNAREEAVGSDARTQGDSFCTTALTVTQRSYLDRFISRKRRFQEHISRGAHMRVYCFGCFCGPRLSPGCGAPCRAFGLARGRSPLLRA